MYEAYYHPKYQRSLDKIEVLMDARQVKLDAHRKPNGDPLTQEQKDENLAVYRTKVTAHAVSHGLLTTDIFIGVEMPIALLDALVPTNFPWALKSDGSTRRTFREYSNTFKESLDGTKVLFLIGGKPLEGCRLRGVDEAEVALWKDALEGAGYNWANIGTPIQYNTRRSSAAYTEAR